MKKKGRREAEEKVKCAEWRGQTISRSFMTQAITGSAKPPMADHRAEKFWCDLKFLSDLIQKKKERKKKSFFFFFPTFVHGLDRATTAVLHGNLKSKEEEQK